MVENMDLFKIIDGFGYYSMFLRNLGLLTCCIEVGLKMAMS